MAGQPAVQRLQDKTYSWDGVARLMPSMIASGIEGHIYNCPDMVGGEFGSFITIDEDKFDQELIVRSCQIHAMMPMMQFSVAPWRILDTYLVAPMYGPGYSRTVKLPKGTWVDETGRKYKGGRDYQIDVPIERLPYFTLKR